MDNFKPYFQVALKYGILGGGLIILLFLILNLIGENPISANKNLDFGFVIIPLMVFFSIKEYRDIKGEGKMFFWQGMTVGFFTYLLIAFISGFFIFIMFKFVQPDLLQIYIDSRIALLEQKKADIMEALSEETYLETYKGLINVSPFIIAIDDFIKKIFTGLFVTTIISVLLRR